MMSTTPRPVYDVARRVGILPETLRLIAETHMSTVNEARHPKWGRVALKVPRRLQDIARFRREAQILHQLDHPCIVRCHDWNSGSSPADSWLVLEYLDTPNLARYLGQNPAGLGESAASHIIIKLCEALEYSYRQPIRMDGRMTRVAAHLDIKPSNVHVAVRGGRVTGVTLLDFGIVQLAGESSDGEVLGQPEYLAPERVQGGVVGPHSDVFSLGVLLYQMLSGRQPFWGRSDREIVQAICSSSPPPLTRVRPELQRIVDRCLAKRPDDRFDSPLELRLALESNTSTERIPDVQIRKPELPRRRRTGLLALGIVLNALGLIGAAIMTLLSTGGTQMTPLGTSNIVWASAAAVWFLMFVMVGVVFTILGIRGRLPNYLPSGAPPAPQPGARTAPTPQRSVGAGLRVTSGPHMGKVIPLPEGRSTFGRQNDCQIVLNVEDVSISRIQGVLQVDAGGATISSSGANPIVVNGRILSHGSMRLVHGALLCIGQTYFELTAPADVKRGAS